MKNHSQVMRSNKAGFQFDFKRYATFPLLLSLFLLLVSARGTELIHTTQPEQGKPQLIQDFNATDAGTSIGQRQEVGEVASAHAASATRLQSPEFKQKVATKLSQRKAHRQKNDRPASKHGNGADQLTAFLLAIFLGGLGVHRFYLGYTGIGVAQLLTGGGCGIWVFIDQIRIATGQLQPRNGPYETMM